MPLATIQRRPRPTIADFLGELAAVAADVPRFAVAPLHRHWHRRWGATDEEVAAAMPGDDLVPHAKTLCTRAVTIKARPELVWPWLVQVGCLRAGFYADDLLDNLGHPSAREILPDFQTLHVGQWVPMSPNPTTTTAFTIAGFETNEWLLWEQPTSTWSWRLAEGPDDTTRLVTRIRKRYDREKPLDAALALFLMEFGDFPMMRRMLLGIKERAESAARSTGEPGDPHGRPLRTTERVLVGLEGFLALCGLGGGIYLATNHLGAMPLRYLEGTWFHTWRWPGLALLFFVGICPALAAGATLRRMRVAPIGHLGVGIGLVSWILLEAAWVIVSPPLQTVMGLVGAVVLALALRELVRDEPKT